MLSVKWILAPSCVLAGMVPVSVPQDEQAGVIPDLGHAEMEDLLHFAITHSNLTLLREMASSGTRLDPSEITQVLGAMHEADQIFFDFINRTLISRDWESVEETLAAIDYMQDYGNHLVDKADLIHKKGALGHLLDIVLNTDQVREIHLKLLDLTVEISQNRESAQTLIIQSHPNIIADVVSLAIAVEDDELAASLISVANSIMSGNSYIQARIDESILHSLAKLWSSSNPGSILFARLTTTFRIITSASSSYLWADQIDLKALASHIGSMNLFAAERLLHVLQKITDRVGESERGVVAEARMRLHAQCVKERGDHDEICSSWGRVSNPHSDEL